MFSCLYFVILISGTLLSYFLVPSLVIHGHTNSLLSKNLFFVFYLTGLVYLIANKKCSLYMLHLFRRLIECYFFRYKRSRMNILQFLLGISYYIIMADHIMHYDLRFTMVFFLLNIGQSISHYFAFKQISTFIHYYVEFLIHFYLFLRIKSLTLFLNLIWLALFISITIKTRAPLHAYKYKKSD